MWKTLDFNPNYEANEDGRIRKINNRYEPKKYIDKDGYEHINLSRKKYRVHRVIAMTFIPNPENKPEVNHINSIRDDNRAENLEWVTRSENQQHAFRNGRHQALREQARENIVKYAVSAISRPVLQYSLKDEFIAEYPSLSEAARQVLGNHRNISLVCQGKRKTASGYKWYYKEERFND